MLTVLTVFLQHLTVFLYVYIAPRPLPDTCTIGVDAAVAFAERELCAYMRDTHGIADALGMAPSEQEACAYVREHVFGA